MVPLSQGGTVGKGVALTDGPPKSELQEASEAWKLTSFRSHIGA